MVDDQKSLADPAESFAVLIGAGEYQHLTALPTVGRTVGDLRDILTDDLYWGLPPERCRVLPNPGVPSEIEIALRDAAEQTGRGGLLLVYYAGHGLVSPRGGALHLSVRATEASLINSTSVPYDWVRERVTRCRAARRVVILDCCYAGRAVETMTAGDGSETVIDSAVVLAAASRTTTAFAPADEEHTAFTGELIRMVRAGLAGGPDPLDVGLIWQEVRAALQARGRPLPELRSHNESVPLVRNAARRQGRRLTGQVLSVADRPGDADHGERLLVLEHRPEVGALAVRLGARTDRPVHTFLAEWAGMATEPKVLYAGGPVDPFSAFGLAVIQEGVTAPPAFRPLSGRVGVLDLGSDPRPARVSDVRMRIFVGYYGWGPGQLEAELSDGRLTSEGMVTEKAVEGMSN